MNNTEDRKRIVKSPTREGKPCRHDGTTVKYISTGNCVQCSIRATEERAERRIKEQDRKLQEQLAALPQMQILIRRDCRLPVLYLIPNPPVSFANRRWL